MGSKESVELARTALQSLVTQLSSGSYEQGKQRPGAGREAEVEAAIEALIQRLDETDVGGTGPQLGEGVWNLKQRDGVVWRVVAVATGADLNNPETYISKPVMPYTDTVRITKLGASFPITVGGTSYATLEALACGTIYEAVKGTVLNVYTAKMWSGDVNGNNPTTTC